MINIALIPIDNRPVCYDLIYDTLSIDKNINVLMPPIELLGDLKKIAKIDAIFDWLKNIKSNQCSETIYYTERQLGKPSVFPVTKLLSDNYTFHTPSKKAVYKKPYNQLAYIHASKCYTHYM